MGYRTHRQMSLAILGAGLSSMERTVLLDMALAVEDGSLTYSWGHERLALAIGKQPGTPAAKQALSHRILPSLINKRMISRTTDAHRGHRAEYELSVLRDAAMGNGPEGEWVTVPAGMGNAQTVTPLPISLPTHSDSRNTALPRPDLTASQRRNVLDSIHAVDARCYDIDVSAFADAELSVLAAMSTEERRERIRDWSGLRSRASEESMDDMTEDHRLHGLLATHGFTWAAAWPTRTPGAPDEWVADVRGGMR